MNVAQNQSLIEPTGESYTDSALESYRQKRDALLKNMDYETIQKAWFMLSHLLLEDGAKVIDMGCGDGTLTYCMAALAPGMHFTGLDKSKQKITRAKTRYNLPNLSFTIGDPARNIFDPDSVDALISDGQIHALSRPGMDPAEIIATQFAPLKTDGQILLRDYLRPAGDDFILLEIADHPGTGESGLKGLSAPDLLVWYAEHARPGDQAGYSGFFLEELPERFPHTRLFRLPYKWAYEFMLRKDDRLGFEVDLHQEYAVCTLSEIQNIFKNLGARLHYCAPQWDEEIIEKQFEPSLRLFTDGGRPIGYPATSFIALARKTPSRKSLHIEERRPVHHEGTSLNISAMRDQKTGKTVDVVSRGFNSAEILPYYIDEHGRLKIYLQEGIARGITNTVVRLGQNLDDKHWSAHMVEPLSLPRDELEPYEAFDIKHSALFARDYLGLKPQSEQCVEEGQDYYPAPDHIDERVQSFYLKVTRATGQISPKKRPEIPANFQTKGDLKSFDAQKILDAISIGLIPNTRLELQILSLFNRLKIKSENWGHKQLHVKAGKISGDLKIRDVLRQLAQSDKRFKNVKGLNGDLRPVRSTFVEEGQNAGRTTGLAAADLDFIIHDGKTVNMAVVLPLTKSAKNDVHAGFLIDHLPVPQRQEGNGTVMRVPSYNIPANVTHLGALKSFLAEKFGVLPHMVIKMGESYYSHIGLTPQRIYPFAVAAPPDYFKDTDIDFMSCLECAICWPKFAKDTHFMSVLARSFQAFHEDIFMDMKKQALDIVKEQFADNRPDWSIPLDYAATPLSRPAEAPAKEAAPAPTPKTQMANEPEVSEELEELIEVMKDHVASPRPEKW